MTTRNYALNVIEEHVTVPPLSSVIISVGTEEPADLEVVIEGDQHLLLNRQICVARGMAELRDGKAKVVLRNFSHEYREPKIKFAARRQRHAGRAADLSESSGLHARPTQPLLR